MSQIADKKERRGRMNLAEIRRRKGFSQKALGTEAGVSPSTIWEIEAGRHSPNPSTLRKIAGALSLTPEEVAEAVQCRP